MDKDKLTPKQDKFAYDIANRTYDFDWQAYDAHYSTKGWTKNAIYVETCKLRSIPKVSLRIKEIEDKIKAKEQITIDKVLEQLSNWLLFDPLTIIDQDTEALLPLKDMDKQSRMSLGEIHVQEIWGYEIDDDTGKKKKVKTGELKKIKFIDKRATADMFMKKFGQYISENQDVVNSLDAIKDVIEGIID